MRAHIIGFRREDGSIKYIEGEEPKKAKETPTAAPKAKVVETTPKESIRDSLMKAYENHRLTNNLTSTPAEEIKDFFKVSLPKMNEDSKKALAEQLSNVTSRYDSTVRTIRQMDQMEYVGHMNSFATTYHDYETDYSEIMLNPAKYGDFERIKELIKRNYSPKIKEEFADRYVITHEFAHSLIDMETELNSKRNWVNADYKKIKEARKEIKSVYNRYVKEVGELEKEQKKLELEAMTSMDEAIWKKAGDLSSELQNKAVSKYALTNSDEFMAECFAHYELGGPQNDYVDEMMQILNKYFGRK
jgi:ribosome recycling factor